MHPYLAFCWIGIKKFLCFCDKCQICFNKDYGSYCHGLLLQIRVVLGF